MKKYKIINGLQYVAILIVMVAIIAAMIGVVYWISLRPRKINLIIAVVFMVIIVFIVGYLSA